jgi:hypothetical protein
VIRERGGLEVDREAAERAYAAFPGGIDGVRADVRAHRALLGRVVRYLAAEAGIRQFLDIGTGIPKQDNTHEVAQRAAPDSRIVYVDNDRSKPGCVHLCWIGLDRASGLISCAGLCDCE